MCGQVEVEVVEVSEQVRKVRGGQVALANGGSTRTALMPVLGS